MDVSALEYEFRQQLIASYAANAKLVLLLYEIFVNFDREVHLVWSTCSSFRWSNVIYFLNRYPVLAYQIWSVVYTPAIPHCDALYQFFWYLSFIPTRTAITASWILRVYAIADHGLLFAAILSILALATIALDILQGAESSCTYNTVESETLSGVLTYICLAIFDVLATSLVTTRMIQVIQSSGGFRILDRQNVFQYVLRSGILYFGAVTIPQLVAVVLYFAPQGLYSPILNNFLLVLSSIMIARFLLGLREINENEGETACSEHTLRWAPFAVGTVDLNTAWSETGAPLRRMENVNPRRRVRDRRGITSLTADFDVEIDIRGR
ncbi:hypothetical protein GYMLUDRAFT_50395 [Collybiopsis luxurians FD-317 M1]|uniref:Unplaced genomic scaffold GYMLUscaffold_110, whole genome shotgun sequence n=1 Tax=Collybiopsis luxurians FD-317 M1 TaxID=944289 RepID=A0A0D0C1M1_9AGAR|nr:hypothetical protein GYMLUDRAFT_50395 [Collybiopsis luxurians FD-317 M1]